MLVFTFVTSLLGLAPIIASRPFPVPGDHTLGLNRNTPSPLTANLEEPFLKRTPTVGPAKVDSHTIHVAVETPHQSNAAAPSIPSPPGSAHLEQPGSSQSTLINPYLEHLHEKYKYHREIQGNLLNGVTKVARYAKAGVRDTARAAVAIYTGRAPYDYDSIGGQRKYKGDVAHRGEMAFHTALSGVLTPLVGAATLAAGAVSLPLWAASGTIGTIHASPEIVKAAIHKVRHGSLAAGMNRGCTGAACKGVAEVTQKAKHCVGEACGKVAELVKSHVARVGTSSARGEYQLVDHQTPQIIDKVEQV